MRIGGKEIIQKTVTAIDAVTFNDTTTTYTSDTIDLRDYTDIIALMDLTVSGTPTDILIELLVSDDDSTYRKYMRGPWGDLRYEDSAGNINEAIDAPVIARYAKVKATARGTTAINTFTLTVKVAAKG